MSEKLLRGSESSQEIREDHIVRDTRGMAAKAVQWLKVPNNLATLLVVLAAIAFVFPSVSDFCLVLALTFSLFGLTREESAPLKLPIQSGLPDKNERHPATGRPTPAAGIFFLGNEIKTGKEVWLTNSDCRQHFLVLGTTGSGKALPLDARVHTPTGWRRMVDLKVGDRVSTPDGRSGRIVGYYPQGEIEICRITFADGRTAEACPEHLWEIHSRHMNGRHAGMAQPSLLRTREVAALLRSNKGKLFIRLPEPVEKPASEVPIDPYLLGALIGDGNVSNRTVRFSTADSRMAGRAGCALNEMGREIRRDSHAAPGDCGVRDLEECPGRISALRSALRELGLEGLHSWGKFIPVAYKEGSVGQRWALVQGLMDTDGAIDKDGSLSFSTASERLARDFQEVVWSLGGIAVLSRRTPACPDGDGRRGEGRPSWRVSVRHPSPSSFFSLPGKERLARRPYRHEDSLKLGIATIETVRRAEAACILIDHPEHLFITDNYVVTHNTEALLGFAANAITWGSGFLFCDGKGDVSLFAKVYALARRFGREDDLLVLNYMTGNQDLGSSEGKLLSNTLNPFATGSSDTLTQMVVGLMDDAGGDGAMWKGRATAMFTGVMRALTWLRDKQIIDLNVGEIRDHLNLKRIIDLADPSKYPDMPQPIRKSVKSYLSSLPGFQEDKGYKQSQTTLDQHGYLEMQFTKILGSLADVYGHIFHTPYGEIDMADVVLNRRILVIMLPALEKSGDEIANLGKIVVATLKGMMGSTLGSQIEGNWDAVVDNRPTNSPSPFIVILDEVGYYMVDGMDLMAAQARSLGFALVFAGQDLNAMKRLNEKVFGSVQGNTSTKLVMKTEDPDTAKIAIEAAGKAYRAHLAAYQGQVKEIGNRSYSDNLEARLEAVDRINLRDLRDQDPGEMHVIHKDAVVRMKSFYASPETSVARKNLQLRANHFITVAKPDAEEIASQQRLPEIVERLADPDFARQMKADAENAAAEVEGNGEIAVLVRTLAEADASKRRPSSPVEAACVAFARLVAANRDVTDAYARDVRGGVAEGPSSPLMPQAAGDALAGHPRPARAVPERPFGEKGFYGFAGDGLADFADPRRPALPDEFAPPPEAARASPRPAASRPFSGGRVRPDVVHGVQVADGSVHDMADRISANESVIRSLAALDFDAREETRESVESGIEEALSIGRYEGTDDEGPFDRAAAGRAAAATHAALPGFRDEEDDEDGDGQQGSLVEDFLGALMSDDGDVD